MHVNELHLLMLLDQIQNKIVLTRGCPVSSLFWLVCFVSLTLTLPTSAIVQNAGWAARTVKKPEKKFMAARPIVLATPERTSYIHIASHMAELQNSMEMQQLLRETTLSNHLYLGLVSKR